MFRINHNQVNGAISPPQAKSSPGRSEPAVFDEYKKMTWNLIEVVGELDVYNMGQWVKHVDKWSDTRGKTHTPKYHRADILMVDFGAMNYGFEFSYEHPCVVLVERKHQLLVVPGSTKKFNSGHPEHLDAYPSDGFQRNTGLLLEAARWVHKNRVVSNTGRKASQRIIDAIEQHNLSYNSMHRKAIEEKNKEIRQLRLVDYQQKQQIADLQVEQQRQKQHAEQIRTVIPGLTQLIAALKDDPRYHELVEQIKPDLKDLG